VGNGGVKAADPAIDGLLAKPGAWREETRKLREIALSRPLTEAMKWGKPCYALDGANIALIQGFKAYCALLLFKGSLLADPHGVLVRHGENVNAPRQMRFVGVADIRPEIVGAYLDAAIEAERRGLKAEASRPPPAPPEWEAEIAADPALRAAFAKLTPGRRRVYLMHFGSAKQAATRQGRIEKWREHILAGKGIDD
jgi:uncharacterized protein YdeI (YjbR/CyaY-like superfamily)